MGQAPTRIFLCFCFVHVKNMARGIVCVFVWPIRVFLGFFLNLTWQDPLVVNREKLSDQCAFTLPAMGCRFWFLIRMIIIMSVGGLTMWFNLRHDIMRNCHFLKKHIAWFKYKTLIQCWLIVGSASQTTWNQHSLESTSCACEREVIACTASGASTGISNPVSGNEINRSLGHLCALIG